MNSEAKIMEHEAAVAAIKTDLKAIHQRIDNLEKLTDSVHIIATETKAMREDVNNITDRVDEIEKRPTKRYETAVAAIITAIVGIIIGHFIKF